ncbi:MAG: hypothetical protein LBT44_02195 [Clostridiales bacterium]|jgi:hypothetical protein|nr:hypothetical protein [Clostridiales bacterium]
MLDKFNETFNQISNSIYEDPDKLRILLSLYQNPFEDTDLPFLIKALGTYGIIPLISGGVIILALMALAGRAMIKTPKKLRMDSAIRLQVMVNWAGAPEADKVFMITIPEGAQIRNLRQLLIEAGKIWARDIEFDDVLTRRDQETGRLLVNESANQDSNEWRAWEPMRPIRKTIRSADEKGEEKATEKDEEKDTEKNTEKDAKKKDIKEEYSIQFRYIKGDG